MLTPYTPSRQRTGTLADHADRRRSSPNPLLSPLGLAFSPISTTYSARFNRCTNGLVALDVHVPLFYSTIKPVGLVGERNSSNVHGHVRTRRRAIITEPPKTASERRPRPSASDIECGARHARRSRAVASARPYACGARRLCLAVEMMEQIHPDQIHHYPNSPALIDPTGIPIRARCPR